MPTTTGEPDRSREIEDTTRPDHHGLGVSHPDTPKPKTKRKRTWRRWLVRGGLLVVVLLFVFVALAPRLLSTGAGTSLVVSLVNSKAGGVLEVEDLTLRWFGGQRATGLRYVDTSAGLEALVGEVDAPEVGLFGLLTGSRRVGAVRFVDAEVIYTQPSKKVRSASKGDRDEVVEKPPFKLPTSLEGSLSFENLRVTYLAQGQVPVLLSLPLGELEIRGLSDIAFDFDVALKQGERTGRLALIGDFQDLFGSDGVVQPMKAAYRGKAIVKGVPTVALGYLLGQPERLPAILGRGELNAHAAIEGVVSQLDAEFELRTPKLHVSFFQEIDGQTLVASPKSSARLELDNESLAALFPHSDYTLLESSGIAMHSLNFRMPTNREKLDWQGASASIDLRGDDNLALRNAKGEIIGINGLKISGGGASLAEQLAFKLEASQSTVDAAGAVKHSPVVMELEVLRPLEKMRDVLFFSDSLPIKLADALSGQDGRMVLWLGEMLEMEAQLRGKVVADADGTMRLEKTFVLRPEGRVRGEVFGEITPARYTFGTGDRQPMEAQLVPEAFANLMEIMSGKTGQPLLTIDKPMTVYISLYDEKRGENSITTQYTKPGLKRFFPDPDRTYVGVSIELTRASVYDPARKKTYELTGGTLSINVPDLRGKAQVRADLRLAVADDAGKEGLPALLTWQTSISDILGKDGGIPLDTPTLLEQIALTGDLDLNHVPSDLFDSLLNRDGDVVSILGPMVEQMKAGFTYENGRATGATIKLNWDEKTNAPLPDASASMRPTAFDIDSQEMLTVRGGKDLEIAVRVSEAFGDRWMGKLHPILFDAKSGDRPVKIKIKGESFRFPLNDPEMKGARVDAEVDLGSVEFAQEALLGKLLDWTGKPGERAVFDPAKVSLIDGKISYEQFGMSVGNVQLKLDGEIDLATGTIVDMAVRVPGKTLISVYDKLDGIIKPDDFLSIPMSGPIRKPEFDRKRIAREVAGLLARGLVKDQTDKLEDRLKDKLGDEVGDAVAAKILGVFLGGKNRGKKDSD